MNGSDLFGNSDGYSTPLLLPAVRPWLYYPAASIFTAPSDMEVIIHAIGAGGSGGVAMLAGPVGLPSFGMKASGAGAGGRSKKRVSLKAGEQLIITPGAGGAGKTANSNSKSAGNDGGNTTVTGPNINIVAGGGKAGSVGVITDNVLGGLGGIATGGDLNFQGGRGGDMPPYPSTGSNMNINFATGGGCVDVFGVRDCNGGDIPNLSPFGASYVYFATAGGSFFQSGPTVNTSTGSWSTNGGGWGRSRNPFSATDNNNAQRALQAGQELFGIEGATALYGGTTINGIASPQIGKGSSSTGVSDGGNTTANSTVGGLFAGSGAAVNNGSSANSANSGLCYFGGGSGGAVNRMNFVCSSGKGGDGWVALELLV